MRAFTLLAASSALACSTLNAQAAPESVARWEAGPAVLAGAGLFVGGSVSFRLIESSRLRVAADVSGFTPFTQQLEWACLNAAGCRNGDPPPQASALVSVGVRTSVPVARRWYAVADAALVQGHWRYPVAGTHRAFAGGFGLGHRSRTDRRALELRWQSVGSGGAPVSTVRVGWLHRW
jgi:hypothetical protein